VKLLRDEKGIRMQFPGAQPTRPISPKLSDLADRRAWMDRNGIDHQLVGGWLDSSATSFGRRGPRVEPLLQRLPRGGACRGDAVHAARDRAAAAWRPRAEVLAEVRERGFGGVMIGTLPKGNAGNLDDPSLDSFWQAASDLEMAVFLHPMFLCGERASQITTW